MKYFTIIASVFFIISTVAVRAEEKIIKFTALPPVVQQSVLSQTKINTIKKVELIYNEGLSKYEVETRDKGISLDITLAQSGAILELERGVTPMALSKIALTEIRKDYPDIKIQKIEAVQVFYYDVEGISGGKKIQFKVTATGDIEDEPNENQKE